MVCSVPSGKAWMTFMDQAIFVGGGGPEYGEKQYLSLKYANRHGLIAGATGTGKTVTLQVLAEGFSAAGVPVVVSDVKGDLAGLAAPGSELAKTHDPFTARARTCTNTCTYTQSFTTSTIDHRRRT